MTFSGEERSLFHAACTDAGNIHAQELMNLFAVDSADGVMRQVPLAPIGVFIEVVAHIWFATLHEASRRDAHYGESLERMLS